MTTTATVETLTAQVHTLVVGTRQVTLSVAKQLDVVPLGELTVMGRVKIDRDRAFVIGSDLDGNLALSCYDPGARPPRNVTLFEDDLLGKIRICEKKRDWDHTYPLTLEHRTTFTADESAVQATCDDWRHLDCVDGWSVEGMTYLDVYAAIDEVTTREQRRFNLHKAAGDAPLIVLAGLK